MVASCTMTRRKGNEIMKKELEGSSKRDGEKHDEQKLQGDQSPSRKFSRTLLSGKNQESLDKEVTAAGSSKDTKDLFGAFTSLIERKVLTDAQIEQLSAKRNPEVIAAHEPELPAGRKLGEDEGHVIGLPPDKETPKTEVFQSHDLSGQSKIQEVNSSDELYGFPPVDKETFSIIEDARKTSEEILGKGSKEHVVLPEEYVALSGEVKEFHEVLQSYHEIGGTDLKPNAFQKWYDEGWEKVESLLQRNDELKERISSQKSGGDLLADPEQNLHGKGLSASSSRMLEMVGGNSSSNADDRPKEVAHPQEGGPLQTGRFIGGIGDMRHALHGTPRASWTMSLPDGRRLEVVRYDDPNIGARPPFQDLLSQARSLWEGLMNVSQTSEPRRGESNSKVGDSSNLYMEHRPLQEEQHDKDNSRFLISENEIEKTLANKMLETRAYLDLWAKYGLEQPNTGELKDYHDGAQELLKISIADIEPQDREDFRENMSEFNQSLKKGVEDLVSGASHSSDNRASQSLDSSSLQGKAIAGDDQSSSGYQGKENKAKLLSACEDIIKETNEVFSKLSENNLESKKYVEDFKSNSDARKVITGKIALSDCSSDEMLRIYVSLKQANAPLKYLFDQKE
jgi:hypothetical protein